MAGSYKYLVIGGLMLGIVGGTVVALTLGGGDERVGDQDLGKATDATTLKPAAPKPEPTRAATAVGGQAQQARTTYNQGRDKLLANDYAGASALFRDALARDPDPQYFLALGTSTFQEGKFDESLRAFNAMFMFHPSDDLKGRAIKIAKRVIEECASQGMPCPPPKVLKSAIELGPQSTEKAVSAESLYQLGKAQVSTNELKTGRESLMSAVAIVPDPDYLYLLGNADLQLGLLEESLAALEQVFTNNPTQEQAAGARKLIADVLAACRTKGVKCPTLTKP